MLTEIERALRRAVATAIGVVSLGVAGVLFIIGAYVVVFVLAITVFAETILAYGMED